jgi:hypothetical protein
VVVLYAAKRPRTSRRLRHPIASPGIFAALSHDYPQHSISYNAFTEIKIRRICASPPSRRGKPLDMSQTEGDIADMAAATAAARERAAPPPDQKTVAFHSRVPPIRRDLSTLYHPCTSERLAQISVRFARPKTER